MAGAGYKLFNTGDVLTAAQVNTYLNEQTVMVFASSAARTSALSGVLAEGMMSYLQDTNAVEVYNGSAWVGVSGAGDVTEVQAGTGISVASGTGPIPVVTNTMATAIDAEGDLIIGDAADAFQRLAIGSNTHVLTVDTSVDGKIKWAAPATGGSLTLLSTTTLTSTSNSITIAPTGYVNLLVLFREVRAGTNNGTFFGRFNADTGSNHTYGQWRKYMGGAGDFQVPQNQSSFEITNQLGTSSAYQSALSGSMDVFRVNDTSKIAFECRVLNFNDSSQAGWYHTFGNYNASAAITNLTLIGSQTLSGTVYIYGVK